MLELGDLQTDTLGKVADLVDLDAIVAGERDAGKQHRFGARPAEIGRYRRKARLEIAIARPDWLEMLVHGRS